VKMDQVCQDKIGRLGGVAGSVVLYVMPKTNFLYVKDLGIKRRYGIIKAKSSGKV
jgi:hypothetical protein